MQSKHDDTREKARCKILAVVKQIGPDSSVYREAFGRSGNHQPGEETLDVFCNRMNGESDSAAESRRCKEVSWQLYGYDVRLLSIWFERNRLVPVHIRCALAFFCGWETQL